VQQEEVALSLLQLGSHIERSSIPSNFFETEDLAAASSPTAYHHEALHVPMVTSNAARFDVGSNAVLLPKHHTGSNLDKSTNSAVSFAEVTGTSLAKELKKRTPSLTPAFPSGVLQVLETEPPLAANLWNTNKIENSEAEQSGAASTQLLQNAKDEQDTSESAAKAKSDSDPSDASPSELLQNQRDDQEYLYSDESPDEPTNFFEELSEPSEKASHSSDAKSTNGEMAQAPRASTDSYAQMPAHQDVQLMGGFMRSAADETVPVVHLDRRTPPEPSTISDEFEAGHGEIGTRLAARMSAFRNPGKLHYPQQLVASGNELAYFQAELSEADGMSRAIRETIRHLDEDEEKLLAELESRT
jgi:hypothetical protein